MKKILIVNKSFETGGIQSSMINMVNELADHCQVDLFVYNPEGPMKERLSPKVNVLPSSWRFRALGMTFKQALRSKSIKIILYRVFAAVWTKLFGNKVPITRAIKHQKKLTGYDVAIAFHQEQRKKSVVSGFSRVVTEMVEAEKKIAWAHFDSSIIDLDSTYNLPIYQKMDKIVCVSRSLMQSFAKNNPALADKVDYCYNFMEYAKMQTQSQQKQEIPYPDDKFVCFSACRLVEEKALVRAVEALAPVFREHADLMWYIAGDGVERENIEKAISALQLSDRIVLIGNQRNPYPYMKNAHLILNVSYHEAAPMVFFEAKALGRPVFATRTSSADELLADGVNSFICENTAEGIRSRFAELMSHRQLIEAAQSNLQGYTGSNKESLEKILSFV